MWSFELFTACVVLWGPQVQKSGLVNAASFECLLLWLQGPFGVAVFCRGVHTDLGTFLESLQNLLPNPLVLSVFRA